MIYELFFLKKKKKKLNISSIYNDYYTIIDLFKILGKL